MAFFIGASMIVLMPNGKQQFFDTTTGAFLNNGYIYTYSNGTVTPKATYTDAAGLTPQANPIRLNSRGEPASPIHWSGLYTIEVHDANDVLIYRINDYGFPTIDINDLTYINSMAGAVSTTVRSVLRQTVRASDFGAVPGASSAVNTAAFNALFSWIRTDSAIGGSREKSYIVDIGTGEYEVSSINATEIREAKKVVIKAEGASLYGTTAGKAVLDMLGSRWFVIHDLNIRGSSSGVPRTGFQLGRTSALLASNHHLLIGCSTEGQFTLAAFYNFASEGTTFIMPRATNTYDSASAYAFVQDGRNIMGVTSDYVSVAPVDTAQSFNQNVVVQLEARKTVNGSGLFLAQTYGHRYQGYVAVVSPGKPIVLDCSANGHDHLHIDIHCETDVPYDVWITGTAPTARLPNFKYCNSKTQAVTAVIGTDRTTVEMENANIVIGDYLHAATPLCDTPAKYLMTGLINIKIASDVNDLPGTFHGELHTSDVATFTAAERPAGDNEVLSLTGSLGRVVERIATTAATPTMTFATVGDLSVVYTTQVLNYISHGKMVYISGTLSFTPTHTTAAGAFRMSGLPFTAANDTNTDYAIQVHEAGANLTYPAGRTYLTGTIAANTAYMQINSHGTGVASAPIAVGNMATTAAQTFKFSGWYKKA